MKRILLTAVGTRDPYSLPLKDNQDYKEGSLLHIIRHFNEKETPITDVYVYLSNAMALQEISNNAIEQGIKYQDENINIHFFPENILKEMKVKVDEVRLKKLEENPNISDRDWFLETFNEIQSEEKVGRVNVNKYGSFYSDFYYILSKIKEQIMASEEQYEILVNVSSGTPAMKDDLNLLAITNNDNNLVIHPVQVGGPDAHKIELPFLMRTKEQIQEELAIVKSNEEESDDKRSSIESMVNIKKLLLKDSIFDMFEKKDYAGVYKAIDVAFQNNILEDKGILYLAKNLYYRYIGNEKVALDAALEFKKMYPKSIKLYPELEIKADNLINKDKRLEKLIEHVNILDVKVKRCEINDWLLILQPVIEFIYSKIIYYKIGLDIDDIKDAQKKISYENFQKQNIGGKYYYLDKIIESYDGGTLKEKRYVNAEFLIRILHRINTVTNDKELDDLISFLDALREYRNEAAHELSFIDAEKLEKDFRKKIGNNVLLKDMLKEKRVVDETSIIINKLLKQIVPDKKGLDVYRNIYDGIEDKIKELINTEVYGEKDYEGRSNCNI